MEKIKILPEYVELIKSKKKLGEFRKLDKGIEINKPYQLVSMDEKTIYGIISFKSLITKPIIKIKHHKPRLIAIPGEYEITGKEYKFIKKNYIEKNIRFVALGIYAFTPYKAEMAVEEFEEQLKDFKGEDAAITIPKELIPPARAIGKTPKTLQAIIKLHREEEQMNQSLTIIVYTEQGHTYKFYDVQDLEYHNRHLKFTYTGATGITKAQFNNVAGITKHHGMPNPNK